MECTTESDCKTRENHTSAEVFVRTTLVEGRTIGSMEGTRPTLNAPRKEYPQPVVLSDATVVTGWGPHIDACDTKELRETVVAHLAEYSPAKWGKEMWSSFLKKYPTTTFRIFFECGGRL